MNRLSTSFVAALAATLAGVAVAQAPAPVAAPAPATPAPASAPAPGSAPTAAPAAAALSISPGSLPVSTDLTSVYSLAWVEGCWAGTVNQRSFREHWTPVRGSMLLGVGSTVFQGKTQDFEFLRIEQKPDGVFYVALPSGKNETPFKLTSITPDDQATLYTFSNAAHDFPQEIIYRRATDGWLYATIQGKLKGEDRKVVFPMRRVDCETGDFIRQ